MARKTKKTKKSSEVHPKNDKSGNKSDKTQNKEEKPKHLECYYCGKLVKANAIKCKYCGKWYSAGKKTIAVVVIMVLVIAVIALLVSILLADGHDPFSPDSRPNSDIDIDDWDIEGDITVPEDDPDIMGRIGEQYDVYSFSIMTRDRTTQTSTTYYVQADGNTNVFLMDMETETVTSGTIYEISPESPLRIWGTQNTDGSWHATDISIMTGMPDRVRP